MTYMVFALFTLNLARVILYAVEGKDEAELIGGVVLMILAPMLKCLICITPIKRYLCILSLVMVYLTIIEWSLSFDDIFGYENRALWVILVALVVYEGVLLFRWSFMLYAGIVILFTIYAILRTQFYFSDNDVPATLLAGIMPIVLAYINGYYYRFLFDFADGFKEEAANWKLALQFAPQGIVILDKNAVYYHNALVTETFNAYDAEGLYGTLTQMKKLEEDVSLLNEVEGVLLRKDRAGSMYHNNCVEKLGMYSFDNGEEMLEFDIKSRVIIWQEKEVLVLTLNDCTEQNQRTKAELRKNYNTKLSNFIRIDLKDHLNGITANMMFLKSHLDLNVPEQEIAYNDMYKSVVLLYMTLYCVEDFLEIEETGELKTKYVKLDYMIDIESIIQYLGTINKVNSPDISITPDESMVPKFYMDRTKFRQIAAALLKYAGQQCKQKTQLQICFKILSMEGSDMRELLIMVTDIQQQIEYDPSSLLLASVDAVAKKIGSRGVFAENGKLCCTLFAPPIVKDNVEVNVEEVKLDESLPSEDEPLAKKYENIGKPN